MQPKMIESAVTKTQQPDLRRFSPTSSDEIDLGLLISNIIKEWKLVCAVASLVTVGGLVYAFSQPSIFRIEALIAAPSVADLGSLGEQQLIELTPSLVLQKVGEELLSTNLQAIVFQSSQLKLAMDLDEDMSDEQFFLSIKDDLLFERIDHPFFEGTNSGLKELSVVMESKYADAAAEYLDNLINTSILNAQQLIAQDIQIRKNERITQLEENLTALTLTEVSNREAAIKRLEDTNQEKIAEIEQQLRLLEVKARSDRLNRIAQLKEALVTANSLGISDPVTWEDLRQPQNAQIINDLSTDDQLPLYFRGSRFIVAEIKMLENRTNDLLYVGPATQLTLELEKIRSDTRLAALKSRADDSIYIANYESLQQQLEQLRGLSTAFDDVVVARVVQRPIAPLAPIKPNRKLMAVASLFIGLFIGLFAALISIAIRQSEHK